MSLKVFGIDFKGLSKKEVMNVDDELKFVTTVNAEFIVEANKNKDFLRILNNSVATFDGQIPYIIAKLKSGKKFDKISGSDLIYDVIKKSKDSQEHVFLLGDREDVNQRAVDKAINEYGARCSGFSPPYEANGFSEQSNNAMLEKISNAKPTYLFVAFGAKKQEQWIYDNLEALQNIGVKWVVGCGGSISFFSGEIKRAPLWVQKAGLEGVYRLVQEPKLFRLVRLVKSLRVFFYVWK
ncbi:MULTISPECIES: WecB/TagA/CpsF family glycosyltransferase [Pseudoalteromonas]|uniref:Exopolysaccharide biosynthesis protein, WecB/TagA/CpsF family n=1 Tax=Pseudoalteromonas luteoviolacea (strain 2ta16) TaxID=1353533 RepID=V4HZ85_PSEL2|nr:MULTISPECIES: WecB/TagA/CpsF family glycosyltransferase [Pseudoalteromonas]ESP95113.1 putative proteinbacterial polymer biosynthesis protein, WecB/TagA/CpsF family [Pseudoalteromonas luteoviolacea 2ta16]KZN42287.1 hypothetical protein N483_12240 [Pseudoalteromonas luteoviolacea NCIMB 1944]MCG7547217.1 WecB/TagA/CpsF family glycosyltransferase [Pseudoalteromonas sp. Of7M-16]